jgi:aspartate aminotransferase
MTPATLRLAERIGRVSLSATMRAAGEAERLRRQGIDVVDLGPGEPDFATPAHVIAAAHAALDAGFTKYTANPGSMDLRAAIAARYREDCGVTIAPEEVIVTAGGKQALFHAAMALIDDGDEVITHAPGWPTIGEQVKLAGGDVRLVFLDERDGFALNAKAFIDAATARTRAIVINSPANPTGAVMTEHEARTLAAEAARRDWWVVLDLCYHGLVYDGAPHDLVRIFSDAMPERFVVCGSASKTYAMTGWRCGWMIGPRALVDAANALQSHETSNANSVAQRATLAALTGPQDCVAAMRDEYQRRRDALRGWLADEPRLSSVTPKGAFYLFPSVTAFLSDARCPTSIDFASMLLRDEHVLVTPGEAFGAPGYIRLSYATSLERLREGAIRLIRFARACL